MAFTATATTRVQRDIQQILGFRDEDAFVASFNRENLYLEARPRLEGFAQTLDFLNAHRDQSGIIYCGTRREVDNLVRKLAALNFSVLPYHAGLEDSVRLRNQALFSRDEVPIMVATVAFGMGINKSNVRFVLHYNLPESLESYYQEIGRAGRDGLRADCLLLFSGVDLQTIYRFIEDGAKSEQAGRQARLQAMVRYAEAQNCRRGLLLEYFGESPAAPTCGFCDNCLADAAGVELVDVTEAAVKLLTCVKLTNQVFGVSHVVNVLRGSAGLKVHQHHHDRLPSYGSGKDRSSAQWKRLAQQLIQHGVLEQDMEHGSLRLTATGYAALQGARVSVTAERIHPVAPGALTSHDVVLFERLRALRRQIADENGVPPYVIFSDRSLVEMATYYPQSTSGLLAVYGLGGRKLEQHGERVLNLMRAYCGERNLPEKHHSPDVTVAGQTVKGRPHEVGELFAAGNSASALQAMYGVKQSTIVEHLYACARSGQTFSPQRILELSELSAEDQARVLASMAELGADRLRPIYDALGETVPFEQLHIMRLYYLCLQGATVDSA